MKPNILTSSVLAIALVSLAEAADTTQPTYRLVSGKGYTVCEAYLRNLRAFGPDERHPVCAPRPHRTNRDFSEPIWEPMDIQQNIELIYRAEMSWGIYFQHPERHPPFQKWRDEYEREVRSGAIQPSLKQATVEFVKGKRTTIVAYARNHAGCEAEFARHGASDNAGHRWFFYNPSTNELRLYEGLLGNPAGALLLFRGRPVSIGTDALGEGIYLAEQIKHIKNYSPVQRCKYDVDDPSRPITMRKYQPVTR
jgi:hypothetical protein